MGLGAAELEMLQSVYFTAGADLHLPGPLRARGVMHPTTKEALQAYATMMKTLDASALE